MRSGTIGARSFSLIELHRAGAAAIIGLFFALPPAVGLAVPAEGGADSPAAGALRALIAQDFANCSRVRRPPPDNPAKAAANCRADGFAAAPDDKLAAVARARADYLRLLVAHSPSGCAAALVHTDADGPPPSGRLQAASYNVTMAMTAASVAGETAPMRRRPPSPDDWRFVRDGMVARGVRPADAGASIQGRLDAIAVAARCRVRIAQYDVIASAPGPVAGRIIAPESKALRYPE